MVSAIVGYTGFVGSYLSTKIDGAELYNSKNFRALVGRNFDVVYFAGLPAAKWIANRDPTADMSNVREIQGVLSTCNIKKFVLISTIDVYDASAQNQDEDGRAFTKEPYGKHRREFEEWIEGRFESHHVIRLPALFGVGLKKNALFDLLENRQSLNIHPDDSYQWYDIEDLYEDITSVVKKELRIANLFSEPIEMKEILDRHFPGAKADATERAPARYDQKSKHSEFYKEKRHVFERMGKFVDFWRMLKKSRDRVVVSNLCWTCERLALSFLMRFGIMNLEIAITKYVSWNNIPEDLDRLLEFKKAGFSIYSLQSLFFGVDCNVFADPSAFASHFDRVSTVCRALGVRRLVFGSPKQRFVPEGMRVEKAIEIFVSAMREVSKKLSERCDAVLCIEPNAREYGCNFIVTHAEALEIVRKIDRANVRANYDVGNAELSKERQGMRRGDAYAHLQLSAPMLKVVRAAPPASLFREYIGKISLEASKLSPDDFEESVRTLVRFAAG